MRISKEGSNWVVSDCADLVMYMHAEITKSRGANDIAFVYDEHRKVATIYPELPPTVYKGVTRYCWLSEVTSPATYMKYYLPAVKTSEFTVKMTIAHAENYLFENPAASEVETISASNIAEFGTAVDSLPENTVFQFRNVKYIKLGSRVSYYGSVPHRYIAAIVGEPTSVADVKIMQEVLSGECSDIEKFDRFEEILGFHEEGKTMAVREAAATRESSVYEHKKGGSLMDIVRKF